MVNRSIRFKIISWFFILVTAILSVFCFLVYSRMRANLFEHADDILELKAEGVVDYIYAYWDRQKGAPVRRGDASGAFLKVYGVDFVKVAERWVSAVPEDLELADIAISLYDPQGVLLASSQPDVEGSFCRDDLVSVRKGKSLFATCKVLLGPAQGRWWRTLTVPVVEDGRIICIVRVAKPLTFVQVALDRLRGNLIFFFVLALAAAVLTGWLLSRLILMPLNRIVHAMRRITADNLNARITLPDTRDEIKNLADTFNGMLNELERSFLAQKQMVQDVSHELRTPLTIIKGEMEVALQKVRTHEEYQAALESSLEEVDRISRMVEDLLLLARFDSRQAQLRQEPFSLTDLVKSIAEDALVLARPKAIHLEATVAADISVCGDKAHLRRAILNIIDNAVKYTSAQGTVKINLAVAEGRAVLSVADDGIGIGEKDLAHIFDRFYRADAARDGAGFGLGLSLAKTVVEAHRGAITAQSRPGWGAVFQVTLPLAPHN